MQPRDTTRAAPDTVQVAIPPDPARLPGDSAREARADSARLAQDTIRAPLARWVAPPAVGIGEPYRWDREALFASGALTLLELIERVPGVTGLRSGWIASPQVAAYLGDVQRVRIFYDGLEITGLDPRGGNVLDLGAIQIWSLEEVSVERGAGELRVYCRSWTTERTSANTRTDVMTGDEETNLYRAFYGKRFDHGEAIQFAAQQYGTEVGRGGGGGDALSLFGRLGWARSIWSADAFVLRTKRTRLAQGIGRIIPRLESERTDAYLRLGAGRPEQGLWTQLIAASHGYEELSGRDSLDSTDVTPSRSQYIAAVGYSRWGARLSGMHRVLVFNGRMYQSPAAELGLDGRYAALSLRAEDEGADSTQRLEAVARLTPLPFLSVAGAAAHVVDRRDPAGIGSDPAVGEAPPDTAMHYRAELGLRLGGLWVTGGGMLRHGSTLARPVVFDSAFAIVTEGEARAAFATARGRVWNALHADVSAVHWEEPGAYRPRWQVRSEVFVRSRWLSRFPSGDFGVLASVRHDYRSEVFFPRAGAGAVAPPSRIYSTLLEIRLVNAVAFWQFRNVSGEQYEIVPGFEMPRPGNFYGVRWQFWN